MKKSVHSRGRLNAPTAGVRQALPPSRPSECHTLRLNPVLTTVLRNAELSPVDGWKVRLAGDAIFRASLPEPLIQLIERRVMPPAWEASAPEDAHPERGANSGRPVP